MEFKDSQIAWIGQIPKHWEVTKINHLYSQRNQKVSDKDFEPLSVTKKGILPQLENAAKTDNGDNRKLVKIGDFVINSRSDRRGSCGISSFDGSVSLINIVLKPRENMNSKYFDWLFHTTLFADEFYKYGNGIVNDLWSTRWDNMKNILVPYPPLNEQKEIAEFLDKKCEIIDKRLSNLERKIKSLKEYKKSLISECVTKGLNPKNMEFKDSQIPWIGEIPKHWKISKIKYECFLKGRIGWQGLTTAEYIEEGAYLVTGVNFLNGNIDWQNCVKVSEWRFNQAPEIQIKNNDLLITKDGTIGKIALTKDTPKQATLNSGVMLIRPKNKNYYEKFLFYILSSDQFWLWFSYINSGNTTIIHLYQNSFDNFSFTLPPLNEQKEIAEFLDKKCKKIDRLNENYTKQIATLKEYKKSLIYECVTGKKEI